VVDEERVDQPTETAMATPSGTPRGGLRTHRNGFPWRALSWDTSEGNLSRTPPDKAIAHSPATGATNLTPARTGAAYRHLSAGP